MCTKVNWEVLVDQSRIGRQLTVWTFPHPSGIEPDTNEADCITKNMGVGGWRFKR